MIWCHINRPCNYSRAFTDFYLFFFNWWNSKMFRMNGLLRERVTARTSCTSRPVILMLLNRREACNTSCSCAAQELHVHCELHFPDNFAICDACVNTHTHTPSAVGIDHGSIRTPPCKQSYWIQWRMMIKNRLHVLYRWEIFTFLKHNEQLFFFAQKNKPLSSGSDRLFSWRDRRSIDVDCLYSPWQQTEHYFHTIIQSDIMTR